MNVMSWLGGNCFFDIVVSVTTSHITSPHEKTQLVDRLEEWHSVSPGQDVNGGKRYLIKLSCWTVKQTQIARLKQFAN